MRRGEQGRKTSLLVKRYNTSKISLYKVLIVEFCCMDYNEGEEEEEKYVNSEVLFDFDGRACNDA